MCINETVQEQLQLDIIEKRKGQLADGRVVEYDVVGSIEVRFENRRCVVDVMVHPYRRELIVNPEHPHFAQMTLK